MYFWPAHPHSNTLPISIQLQVWSLASRWRCICFPADKQLCWRGSRHVNPSKVSCNLRSLNKFKFKQTPCRKLVQGVPMDCHIYQHICASGCFPTQFFTIPRSRERSHWALESESRRGDRKRCALSLLPFHAPPFVGQVVGYRSSRTLCHWFLTLQQSICLWV